MKKVLSLVLLFLCFGVFLINNLKLEALQYEPGLFDGFETKNVYLCYRQIYDDQTEEISYRRSLYLFVGSYNSALLNAYVLYDYIDNDILEYSFSSSNPWGQNANEHNNLIYLINGNHMIYYKNQSQSFCRILETNEILETPNEFNSFEFQFYSINLDLSDLNIGGTVEASHTIDNAFYFQNLHTNFGLNVNHSCGYVAIGMLLSYYNEFYDGRLLPNTINTTINNELVSLNYEDYYNETMSNSFDISEMESPGANDLFHNFLIDFTGESGIADVDTSLSTHSYKICQITKNYLNNIYGISNTFSDIDYRYLTDDWYYNNNYEYFDGEQQRYEYYENQNVRNNLIMPNGNEFAFDLLDELDNNYPVIICLSFGYIWSNPLENFDQNLIDTKFTTDFGHVALAYGYEIIDGEIFFKCHLGYDRGINSYTDVYIKKNNINSHTFGISLRPYSDNLTLKSGYHHINGDYDINLPTNNIYHDYNSFVKGELNCYQYDDELEYYTYPNSNEIVHAIPHSYRHENISTTIHHKYCNCGYSVLENHTVEHYTDLYGHVQHCLECNSYYRATSEITNIPISEFQHQWTCTRCNESGISLHDLIFIPINQNIHNRMCSCCSYSEHVGHGQDESEIQYYEIDETTHLAICDRCGFNWIENHNSRCHCN